MPHESRADTSTRQPADLHRFCVAPMMDWTDRHCRYFMRLLSRRAFLYTEMVTTGALIHGDTHRFLRYNQAEHPVALQLGGSDPAELAECTRLAASYGYDEVNLNAGCPSDRVQHNRIGACLMAEPALVRDCLEAMQDAADIPISLKTRIGIDDMDSDQALIDFVGTAAESGCRLFILHARIAILEGLSPKQNREVPPLNPERVCLVKSVFPDLQIIINGGINSLDLGSQLLQQVDGVMLGREAYQNPWLLADVDSRLYGDDHHPGSRQAVIEALLPYVREELAQGTRLQHISRHLLGLFQGQPGGRRYRRHLSENAHRPDADARVLEQAAALVNEKTQTEYEEWRQYA